MENKLSIYLNSINNKKGYNTTSIKYLALYGFYNSIDNYPKDIIKSSTNNCNSKICTMLSFYKNNNKNSVDIIRKEIYENNEKSNWIFFEANPLARYRKYEYKLDNEFLRVCFESVYHSESKYISTKNRWDMIKKKTGIEVLPWRKKGKHIVIIFNSCSECGYSMKNTNIHKWVNDSIQTIRESGCKREIKLRFKCKYEFINIINKHMIQIQHKNKIHNLVDPIGNFTICNNNKLGLVDELHNAWATVLYSTSACVISVIKGIPVFVGSKDAITYNISNTDLSKIENPIMPDRDNFFHELSNQLWSLEDISNGTLWKEVKNFYKL